MTLDKKKSLFIVLVSLFPSLKAQQWTTDEEYIQKFARYAVEEMNEYKIPASIKLAQGLLETGGGQSRLAKEGKNHFGIKCKENWTGPTMSHTDDAPNECFRVYEDPRSSYRDHSLFLRNRKHYAPLFSLNIKDYVGWAYGLKRAGYATNPRYSQILISKIEKYRLQEFDHLLPDQVDSYLSTRFGTKIENPVLPTENQSIESLKPKPAVAVSSPNKNSDNLVVKKTANKFAVLRHENNQVRYVTVDLPVNIEIISKKFNIPLQMLQEYNDLAYTDLMMLSGDRVFLEPKAREGKPNVHIATFGQTMWDIAQLYAIRLRDLYEYNNMKPEEEPRTGKILKLKL